MLGLSHPEILQQGGNIQLPGSFSITLHHRSGIKKLLKSLSLVLMFLQTETFFFKRWEGKCGGVQFILLLFVPLSYSLKGQDLSKNGGDLGLFDFVQRNTCSWQSCNFLPLLLFVPMTLSLSGLPPAHPIPWHPSSSSPCSFSWSFNFQFIKESLLATSPPQNRWMKMMLFYSSVVLLTITIFIGLLLFSF